MRVVNRYDALVGGPSDGVSIAGVTPYEEDQHILASARVIGFLETLLRIIDTPAGRPVAVALFFDWTSSVGLLGEEIKSTVAQSPDALSEMLADNAPFPDIGPEAVKAIKEYCETFKGEEFEFCTTTIVKRRYADPTNPETFNKGRIESILKALDIDIRTRINLSKTNPPSKEAMDFIEKQIAVQFQALAQYGIEAKTFAEAQRQFQERYREESKVESVEEIIEREIEQGMGQQAMQEVALDALEDRARAKYPERTERIKRIFNKYRARVRGE